MSLDLLKEKFGYSGFTKETDNKEKIHERLSTRFIHEKEVDNREKIHEKLNAQFNTNVDFKSIKVQHQEELDEKQRIIESLEIQIDNLNESKRMEDKINLTTKQIYEDKIKKMSYADSTELIPLLISVSRKKQGNKRLDWSNWLKIAENKYLFQINESLAKKVFEDTSILVDRAIGSMYRKRTRGGDEFVNNYSLTFSGDKGGAAESHVTTDFNPDDYDLNLGFTVSYWIRPDEVGTNMFAFGRKHNNNQRFVFGVSQANKIHIGIGGNKLLGTWGNGLASHASGQTAAELFPDLFTTPHDSTSDLIPGTWMHFTVTYADRESTSEGSVARKVYLNGELVKTANINWSATGGGTGGMYFGARNLTTVGYNYGMACGLDEIAIFGEEKDSVWVSNTYNGGVPTDLQSESGLVGYWRFEEGSGTTVKDLSGNGNHGTFAPISGDTTALPTWSKDTP